MRSLILALGFLIVGSVPCVAQSQDDLTSAYLFGFTRLLQWPPTTFASEEAPFTVGIVGRPAYADSLAAAVNDRDFLGRSFKVRKLADASGADSCQIIFVEDPGKVEAILSAIKGKPVLSVGVGADFIKAGGMIALTRVGTRLVFNVNPEALRAAKLKFSPRLLKAAQPNVVN